MLWQRRDLLKLSLLTFVQSEFPSERFGVISDTHQFNHPTSLIVIDRLKNKFLDFIVVAGDVSEVLCGPNWIFNCNGGTIETGWQWTVQKLNSLNKEWVAIPGNHDLINTPTSYFEPIGSQELSLWGQYVGPLQFAKETQYCKIVGVNYLNWDYSWMSFQLSTMKHKIVVSHIPLFGVQPTLRDMNAEQKINFLLSEGVDLFICGHSHQFSISKIENLVQVVCPSSSYTLTPDHPNIIENGVFPIGIPTLGWLEIEASMADLKVELYRFDNQKLLHFQRNNIYFPFIGG